MATVFKRCACLNWETCEHTWYERVQRHGRRVRVPLGASTKAVARRIRDKKAGDRALMAAGIPVVDEEQQFLEDAIVTYIRDHAKIDHPATAATKDVPVLASLLHAIGNITLRMWTNIHTETWRSKQRLIVSRRRPLSEVTINRRLVIVRAFAHWCERQGWVEAGRRSPIFNVNIVKTQSKRRKILTTPEHYRIVRDMPRPYNIINGITLRYLPRLAEVCRLHEDDLSPVAATKPYIEVRRKGGRIDKIYITTEDMALLRAQLTAVKQGYLFPHPRRRVTNKRPDRWTEPWLCPANVSVFNSRYFAAHGMKGIGNHALRHSATTHHLSELHTDAATLQVMGGWTSRRMLDVYGHATDKSVQTASAAGAAHVNAMLAAADAAVTEKEQADARKPKWPQNGPTGTRRSA